MILIIGYPTTYESMRLKEELTKKNLNFKMIRWQDIVLPFNEIPELCLIRGSVDLDIHFAVPYMETIIEELERMGCITIPPIKMITKCDKATTYLLWKKYLKNVIKMPESIITVNVEKGIQFLKTKKIVVFKPMVGGLGRGVELIKEDEIEKLENLVFKIFSDNDFHKVDMRTIANEARVSTSTIYKYFQSKERLLFYFVDKRLTELTERLMDHLQGLENIKEKIRKLIWIQLDFYERNPDIGHIIFMTIPLKTWMSDESYKQQDLVDLILNVLQEGQEQGHLDPNIKTVFLLDIIFAMIRRSFSMWVYRGRRESLAGQSNIILEMIWRGIINPQEDHNPGH